MERTIEVNGRKIVLRMWTKQEASKFESKYRLQHYANLVATYLMQSEDIWQKVSRGLIAKEVALGIIKMFKEEIERFQEKYLDVIEDGGLTRLVKAQAEKLVLCVVEPKLSIEEWLSQDEAFFNRVHLELEKYLSQSYVDEDSLASQLRQYLRTCEQQNLTLLPTEVLNKLDELEAKLTRREDVKKK